MQDLKSTLPAYDEMAHRAADKAETAIVNTRRAADSALDSLQEKVSHLASVAPSTLSRVAAQVDDLTRRSAERARAAKETVHEQAVRAGDRTVSYIRDEPVKAVLLAAAAGAALAAVIAMLARSQHHESH